MQRLRIDPPPEVTAFLKFLTYGSVITCILFLAWHTATVHGVLNAELPKLMAMPKKHKCNLLNRWRDPETPRIEIKSLATGRVLAFEKEYIDFVSDGERKLLEKLASMSSGETELTTKEMTTFKEAAHTAVLWARKYPAN